MTVEGGAGELSTLTLELWQNIFVNLMWNNFTKCRIMQSNIEKQIVTKMSIMM